MRRYQKNHDGNFSSHGRDCHLRFSKVLNTHSGNCNGNVSSRSSKSSCFDSYQTKFKGEDKSCFSESTVLIKHQKNNIELIGCSNSNEMCSDIPFEPVSSNNDGEGSDSMLFCDDIEDEANQDASLSFIHHSPILPEYFEACDLLVLPTSSNDLLIENKFVMPLLGLYEILKRFHRNLRLSYFRFEDLCAAIQGQNQSPLIAEIYMCLTKALLRADDIVNIAYGAHDVKDSINIFLYSSDYMSWFDILKCYIEGDCPSEFKDVLQLLNKSSYFSISLEDRITLMQCLTELFLMTDLAREESSRESGFQHEDQCRLCHKLGDLLCCETCPAVYHLECVNLLEVPQGDWICAACKQSEIAGVTDCIGVAEREGLIGRVMPVGFDRHARRYWFLCRRIFVESDTEMFYYSIREQFESLVAVLDKDVYEKYLFNVLVDLRPEILRQMEITKQLTKDFQGNQHSIFDSIHDPHVCFQSCLLKILQSELPTRRTDVTNDSLTSDPSIENKTWNKLKLSTSASKQLAESVTKSSSRPSQDYHAVGKEGALRTKSNANFSRSHIMSCNIDCCCFKLGMEGSCFSYENQYSTNHLSLSRHLYIEEKEKRRHLSYKFSIPLSREFHWFGPTLGDKDSLTSTFKETLIQLEACLPLCFMHSDWSNRKYRWIQEVSSKTDVRSLSNALVDLQVNMRSILFNHVWHDNLGHTSLKKTNDKEDAKRRWRLEGDETFYDGEQLVKYSLGIKHQLWKVKGEEYRIFGNGGWIWISNQRKSRHEPAMEMGLHKIHRQSRSKRFHPDIDLGLNRRKNNLCINKNKGELHARFPKDLDELSLPGDFSITDSILDDNYYLQSHQPPLRLDGLLDRRLKQLEMESELRAYFDDLLVEFGKNVMNKSNPITEHSTTNPSNIHECCHAPPNYSLNSDASRVERELKTAGGERGNSIIADNVWLDSHSLKDLREMFATGKLQMSQELVSLIRNKLRLLLKTDSKTSLGKPRLHDKINSSYCRDLRMSNVLSTKFKDLFSLNRRMLRFLARREGKLEVTGFNYNCKPSFHWPYPAPRPSFKLAWQYRTQNCRSLSSLCSNLRIMWSCLRWDDLMAKTPVLPVHTSVAETCIKSTEVISKREDPKDCMKSEYLVRELVLHFADDGKISEVYTPQRSGLRERKKATTTLLNDPIVTERWVSEDDVELGQIKFYEERMEKQRVKSEASRKELANKTSSLKDLQSAVPDLCIEHNSTSDVAKKITVICKSDGQIEIHGLQENQQIIQLPNGDIHIATSIESTSSDAQNLAFILGPKIPLPRQQPVNVEITEKKVSKLQHDDLRPSGEELPSIIPRSSSLVSSQLLLQVVGQAMMATHNSELRNKLLLMQRLIQQKSHHNVTGDGFEGHSKSTSSGGKVAKSVNSTLLNQEEREEQMRTTICGQVIRQMLDAIERNERMESKNQKKQEMTRGKIRQIVMTKLEVELQKRKEKLRRDILYKKVVMTQTLKQQIEDEVEKDAEATCRASESESNVEESSLRSHKSSASIPSDSEASCSFSAKKKRPRSETSEETYCLCNTPYDNSKFYIGCDQCQNWFHGSCVGITKPEAEKLSTYLCPNCRQPNSRSTRDDMILNDSHWFEVEKVVNNLMTHKSAWPFLRPVDPNEAPNYYSIITDPMDLSTIEKKVGSRRYKSLPDFINDAMKIFENCRYYNSRNTKFYKCADILEIYFSNKLRTLRARLKLS